MPERLVDVEKPGERLLHTFPVTVDDPSAPKDAYKEKALEGAAHAGLVPDEELCALNARMHVARGGPLEPYGDTFGVLAETKQGLTQLVREQAFALWEEAGKPDGRPDEFWHTAQHRYFCQRAYALWQREGCPEGRADAHWARIRAYEEC